MSHQTSDCFRTFYPVAVLAHAPPYLSTPIRALHKQYYLWRRGRTSACVVRNLFSPGNDHVLEGASRTGNLHPGMNTVCDDAAHHSRLVASNMQHHLTQEVHVATLDDTETMVRNMLASTCRVRLHRILNVPTQIPQLC